MTRPTAGCIKWLTPTVARPRKPQHDHPESPFEWNPRAMGHGRGRATLRQSTDMQRNADESQCAVEIEVSEGSLSEVDPHLRDCRNTDAPRLYDGVCLL